MANSSFSLDSILGWLKGFLNKLPCPVSGFDMSDVKVNQKGDVFSSLFQLSTDSLKDKDGNEITDIKGQKIELNVLLSAINAGDVFSPIFKGLNNIGKDDADTRALLFLLLGKNPQKFDSTIPVYDRNGDGTSQEDTDNSDYIPEATQLKGYPILADSDYDEAKKMGKGLLGVKFDKDMTKIPDVEANYGGKTWSWKKIAEEYLRYSLECQSPGRNHGAIENQPLSKCGQLISEYLVKVDVIVDASEVEVDIAPLVLPILARMQARLAEYYNDAYNKYIKKQPSADNAEQEGEAQQENGEQNPNEATFEDLVDNGNGEGGNPVNTNQAKKISVTLRKIQGSDDINILALKSNYSPSETLDDVEDILIQDEFQDSLTEEPQSFSIGVDDDGYDIEQCPECENDPCESLGDVLRAGIKMYRNLYIIHWMSKGNDMMKLHLLTEDFYEELIKEIDTLGELMVEKCGKVIDPNFACDYVEVKDYEFQASLDILSDFIQTYIDTIDYAYPNQTSDVQSTFDEWLRYWNKQLNYFVKGQET